MENLSISSIALKVQPHLATSEKLWAYCVLKTSNQSYCTECKQIISKDGVKVLEGDTCFEINLSKSHFLFKVEVWDYDTCKKLAETHLFNADLPKDKANVEHIVTD